MLELYENIRNLRKKNHWTQEELASRTGYSDRSMIAKIESGKVDLTQSKILEFAKVFGVSAGDLMGSVDNSAVNSAESERNKRFIDLFQNADPYTQELILNSLEASQRKS